MKYYQKFVAEFDQTPAAAYVHALGLASEAGEVAGEVRDACAFVIGNQDENPELRDHALRYRVLSELGDTLYYLTALAQDYGWSLEDVAAANMAKLRARHPDREEKP